MIKAHRLDFYARRYSPHHWREPSNLSHSYVSCSYCGSMSPGELVFALDHGAKIEWADRKYGWPHKVYVSGHTVSHAKFYVEHLEDATAEQKVVIERALGLTFTFSEDGRIDWKAFEETPDAP